MELSRRYNTTLFIVLFVETHAMATDLGIEAEAPSNEDASDFEVHSGDSALLSGISWKMYRQLRKLPENYNIRMTYDRGELEIMSPSAEHEGIASLVGDLIKIWALELRIPMRSCRTMTIRRSALKRGFEPDNCYYVQHEPEMWNKKKINFKTDPPPDLAVEVEVSRKLLNKIEIYLAFRVPELWCCNGSTLKVYELCKEGKYAARDASICFPGFPIAKVEEILRQLGSAHETDLILAFRDWVRDNVPG
jgi:Uma2 family endonuclease